ncbi:hypothetical protein AN958_02998 [Leucoagaricus sp. SymC.cos]|nr:hypothetical protein AN958_02998 [Leucoagaricus sp. SymC.cos]
MISPPRSATLESPRSFDYWYAHGDGIRESFLSFSSRINDLDKQLGKFANDCLKLGRVAGLLLAIKSSRGMLRRTREVFFRNAVELLPELHGLAHKACTTNSRDPDAEQFYISHQYFKGPPPPFEALPTALEELAKAFSRLHVRIAEFREFTDEGLFLKSLLLTMERDLLYRASCARVYSSRLNTPPIQRYVHQFTDELEKDFEKVTEALSEFTSVGVSAIEDEQQRSSQNLSNILTVATFFSGVTAGTLAMSLGTQPEKPSLEVATMLWFASLVFSVGAALNSLLAMAWKETRSGSRGGKMPFWVTMWIDGSQLLFLGVSIVTFSAGLVTFAFSSGQPIYTPYVTVGATAITFIGLIAILIWLTYEIAVSPALVEEAEVIIKSSGESVHSNTSKFSFGGHKFSGALSNALFSLGLPTLSRNEPQEDVEKTEDKSVPVEESSPSAREPAPPESAMTIKTKLQTLQVGVKNVSLLSTAANAFLSVGQQHRRSRHSRLPSSPRVNQLAPINTNVAPTPMTQLNFPTEPAFSIELGRYGTVQDIAYSEDGKWLAASCAKANTGQSWTTVYDAESLKTYADTWHEGRVISERLIWSPSGTKLIIKFEHRFDIWDLVRPFIWDVTQNTETFMEDAKDLHVIERHHNVKDVQWYGDDAFLVAEHNCVFKMNLVRLSPEEIEPASGRSEKRILIYDMDKQESIYQVPVLENISNIYPIPGELDMLVTHADHKAFQLWYLDAGLKGAEITTRLKKRAITPQPVPSEYGGPTCIAGNHSQFILNVTSAGVIDFWRRESGAPHQRFENQKLQDEGVACFSWRKSNEDSATFATAGIDSNILRIWRGEELVIVRTPTALDSTRFSNSKSNGKNTARNLWQQAFQMSTAPSSSSSGDIPHKVSESPDESLSNI